MKSLRLNMGKRQWMVLKNLANEGSNTDWDSLSFRDKLLVRQTDIDVSDVVQQEKLDRFDLLVDIMSEEKVAKRLMMAAENPRVGMEAMMNRRRINTDNMEEA